MREEDTYYYYYHSCCCCFIGIIGHFFHYKIISYIAMGGRTFSTSPFGEPKKQLKTRKPQRVFWVASKSYRVSLSIRLLI
jgi:hypothetical protein